MKTFFLASALAIASTTIWAQTPPAMPSPQATESAVQKMQDQDTKPKLNPQDRAMRMAQRLTTKLGLSAEQSTQVQTVLLEQFTKLDQLRQQHQARAQAKAIKQETDAKLQQILGPEKYAKMQAMRQEQRQKRGMDK
jgi:hypothetical protein